MGDDRRLAALSAKCTPITLPLNPEPDIIPQDTQDLPVLQDPCIDDEQFCVQDNELPDDASFDIRNLSLTLLESLQSFKGFQLVNMWRQLEKVTGFPSTGKGKRFHLSAKNRPKALSEWMTKRLSPPSFTEHALMFLEEYQAFYKSLQPKHRASWNFPLPKSPPTSIGDWEALFKGGRSGFFILLVGLSWMPALVPFGVKEEDIRTIADDMVWVLGKLLSVAEHLCKPDTCVYHTGKAVG